MDIYETPYEHFGRLTYEMWRACRLVIDTGIHAMGWTREQALDYLASNTALSMHEVTTEIDRYISWPGQALSYKLGEYTIWQLRHKAEQDLAVAAASILARDEFVQRLRKLGKQFNLEFPKGASAKVDQVAKEFVNQFGGDDLSKVAKVHFRTAYRAKGLPEPPKSEWKKR